MPTLPLSQIIADPARFQMRENPYSDATVEKITRGFDPALFDPLPVFQMANGQYVIAGDSHSRFEAAKRLVEAGGAAGFDSENIPVQIVTEADAERLALRANSKSTPFQPMEHARVFAKERERQPDISTRDIGRIHSKSQSFVQQHLALNHLPAVAQDDVRMGVLPVDLASTFGQFVGQEALSGEDAAAVYGKLVRGNEASLTKNGLATALQTLSRIPKPDASASVGGLFDGDETEGGTNYAAALTELAQKQATLDTKKRALAGIKSAAKRSGTQAVNMDALEGEIRQTERALADLGAGIVSGANVGQTTIEDAHARADAAPVATTAIDSPSLPTPPVTAPPAPAGRGVTPEDRAAALAAFPPKPQADAVPREVTGRAKRKVADALPAPADPRAEAERFVMEEMTVKQGRRDLDKPKFTKDFEAAVEARLREAVPETPSSEGVPPPAPPAATPPGAGVGDDPYTIFQKKRAAIVRAEQNRAVEEGRAPDSKNVRDASRQRFAEEGLTTESDAPSGGRGVNSGYAALAVFGSLSSAFRSGSGVGNAVGAMAEAISRAVGGAAGAFAHVGESILGLILAPFGASGNAISRAVSGVTSSILSGFAAAGSIVAAGAKIGTALAAGITLTAGTGITTAIGAAIGSIFPGIGTLAGAVAGAGLGAAIAGTVTNLITSLGGAVGQALGAVGKAFGDVGRGIADTISSFQAILSDLTQSGITFANATQAIARTTGGSVRESAQTASLSQLLTGRPDGLSGMLGFGTMDRYLPARNTAFGVGDARPFGPEPGGLNTIFNTYRRYKELDAAPMPDVQKQILLQGQFGGAAGPMGRLFSQDENTVFRTLKTAARNAPTAQETRQNAKLGFDLSIVESQVERLKTKFLSDLMPAIELGLGAVTRYFAANEGKIVGSLMRVAEWLYVKLPTVIEAGANAFFELGKSFALALPSIAQFGSTMTHTLAEIFNMVAGFPRLLGAIGTIGGGLPGIGPLLAPLRAFNAVKTPYLDADKLDPMWAKMAAAGTPLYNKFNQGQIGTKEFLGDAFGKEAGRQKAFDAYASQMGREKETPEVTVTLKQQDNPQALYNYKAEITQTMARNAVRVVQRQH